MTDVVQIFKKIVKCTMLLYDLKFTTPCWSAISTLLHLSSM